MSLPTTDSRRIIMLAAALAIGVWAVFGFADLPNRPEDGFRYDADGVVGRVEDGGPAQRAGLLVGDRIVSIDGIPLSEPTRIRRQRRAAIGETRPIVVERTDDSGATTREELEVTYASELASYPIGVIGGALLGIMFLLCGVLAYLRAPSTQALLFGIIGIGLAVVLLPSPYLPTPGLRSFSSAVAIFAAFAVFVVLLHLVLIFPEPRSMLQRRAVVAALYLPGLLLGAVGAIQFAQRGQPGPVVGVVGTLVLIGYMLLSIVALIHRYATATREIRVAYGLSLLAWGIVIGFGPLTVSAIVGLIAPSVSLPGSDYYFLAMALIPLSFTAALWRWSAHADGGVAARVGGV